MLRQVIASAAASLFAAQLYAAPATTALIQAVKNSDTKAIVRLIQERTDVNAALPDGMTALHWAAQSNDVAAADLLLRAGANISAANRYVVTPLALACANGSAPMVRRLLEAGADANASLPGGETAL